MILQAENITKTFHSPQPIPLLCDISLQLQAGESIAICGRSGEGKTTLLHILGTLALPDSGSLWIAGQKASPSNSAALRNAHVGFVFQSYNLLEDFSLLENVLMPQRIARKKPEREQGLALLDKVGLLDRADFPAKVLSGGEKQRAALARALANDPDLLLADEPTGNLDRDNAASVGALLLQLVKERNKGLILVTHDPDLAHLCSRRYLLKNTELLPL